MDVLEKCTGLVSLNGYDKFREVVAGGVSEVYIEGMDLAIALHRFFPRSAATLSSIDLRCIHRD